MKTYNLSLTYNELLLLDGHTTPQNQAVIDEAKAGRALGFAHEVIGDIMVLAMKEQKLKWAKQLLRHCIYCNKNYAYIPYQRTSPYHKKGSPNFDKPINYPGFQFMGRIEICADCAKQYDIINTLVDTILDQDLQIEFPKVEGRQTRYLKVPHKECSKCKNEHPGHLFVNGICPDCGTQELTFRRHKTLSDKYEMVPVANINNPAQAA